MTTSAAAACSAKSSSALGAGRAQVDSPKIVSPSITVCTGLIARARPSWPIVASRAAPALSSVRSVATTASVVAVPGVGGLGATGATGATGPNSPSTSARSPCGRPDAGSIAEPTALSTTSAATVAPLSSTALAVPTPPFRPPTTAPAPAPTTPSATGPSVAAS